MAPFLPDQRRFLLFALGTAEVRGLYVGSLDGRAIARVGALWASALNREHTARAGPRQSDPGLD